jgi:hypothetical protein
MPIQQDVEMKCERRGGSQELDVIVITPGEFYGRLVRCSKAKGARVEGARYKGRVEHCKKIDATTNHCITVPYNTILERIDID